MDFFWLSWKQNLTDTWPLLPFCLLSTGRCRDHHLPVLGLQLGSSQQDRLTGGKHSLFIHALHAAWENISTQSSSKHRFPVQPLQHRPPEAVNSERVTRTRKQVQGSQGSSCRWHMNQRAPWGRWALRLPDASLGQ